MRARLMRWLVCPICAGELNLIASAEDGKRLAAKDDEVELICDHEIVTPPGI